LSTKRAKTSVEQKQPLLILPTMHRTRSRGWIMAIFDQGKLLNTDGMAPLARPSRWINRPPPCREQKPRADQEQKNREKLTCGQKSDIARIRKAETFG
jgi:hypothetical protein